ncbi:tRNA (adenosine(37)-N6)-threonylcarbamoyltransferase complex transferase subunit TsaD [Candidatus Woesearchaeota archaeon]|jgi:glycoprotease/Kae1 family metallohydrolase|nr:tRNA (adenosine(37)-N6)-threonylcarbamoyltransferase complex transferase subunit TsaD [Candidatus Woesearchaeota archaeon]MBT3438761.1 tRNA (adenosine(37)-N6)-threonylcarbamoyltransferase complex transferase subunit TsaD [Candidatus Woesearchaeota archaeon]MBT4058458.1 tRNA (adenosine(37)-N6)-threonylcarbamoyltransferase complex transferase subunit TsaD [Candidatus Woesearchaeota archaeon]MBT4208753.1 tRNA (adenosine(37)-N6)-threonylcarbamoyltransferase complex transferase subunit TsaD [Candi
MICLGIESTAHTIGVGIVSKKNVLVNLREAYTTESGGIIPMDAANHHKDVKDDLIKRAIEEFEKLGKGKIDLVSYSRGPGIGPCLQVGKNTAAELAKSLDVPFIGINHCVSHLSVGSLVTPVKDPVMLYASGANTQVIAYEGGKYRVFGETLDQGIGNFLDSFARHVGLGFPGGPKIEKLAKDYTGDYIELPYSVKGMDISLSGLLTNLKNKHDSEKFTLEGLSYSLQETAFAMLIEVAERAMAHCDKNELLLGGGVACNARLQEMAGKMCKERGAKCFVPQKSLLIDNGAMIAYQGILEYESGTREKKVDIRPYERTDDVLVNWKN